MTWFEPSYTVENSHIDENGIRVITKARLHSVNIVPESWIPREWREKEIGVMKVLDKTDDIEYTKDSGESDEGK